jgi:hypothetical protein
MDSVRGLSRGCWHAARLLRIVYIEIVKSWERTKERARAQTLPLGYVAYSEKHSGDSDTIQCGSKVGERLSGGVIDLY